MASPRPCAHAETPPPAPLPGLASPAMEKLKAALAGDGAPRRPETELRACHRQLAAAAPPSSSTDRAQVNPEEELEGAKREYLQAAVGVSAPERLAIPKLLHWYLLDFAKDVDSLMDCVCLQLPTELRQSAMRAVDEGRRRGALAGVDARRIQVLPYEFRFRYLLAREALIRSPGAC